MSLDRQTRRRQVKELSAKLLYLRKELRSNEMKLVKNDALIAELNVEAIKKIENYVDTLAKLANVDGGLKSEEFQGAANEEILDLLVELRWHNVETLPQAKEALAQEVARRSTSKTNLALLLSSIDQTAFRLIAALPEAFKPLHGEEFVKEVVESLVHEDFTKALLGDPKWVEMRRLWVRLGWRGTDEENFNAGFIRAAAERVREMHDGARDGVVPLGLAIHDTIIDEWIQKERPDMQDRMIEAFRLRLEREYESLNPNIILNDVLNELPPEKREEGLENFKYNLHREYDKYQEEKSRTETTPSLPPYSDHELMRQGRNLWDLSYAKGMSDEVARAEIASFNSNSRFADETALFAAKWAVHAFQRLMTSHTFAAALMCSDVQRDVLLGIEKQWDAFLVVVPNGMLGVSGLEFSRILVATYSFGARMILLTTGGPELTLRTAFTGIVSDEAATLADLLVSDGSDLHEDAATKRCLIMAKRLVAGLLLNLQNAGTHKIRKVEERPKSKKREGEPEHRIVTVGAPLEIDCRDAVKEYIEHGTRSSETTGRRRGTPTVQWMVRGHFRMQAHGPKHSLRRKTWIRPHWQGQEAALIQTRPRVPS